MGSISQQNSTVLRLLDTIHAQDPTALYCLHPVSSEVSDGWVDITIADLVSATNRFASWIHENVASADEPQALAYMGANDIRYCAFVFACMRLRHTVMPLYFPLVVFSRVTNGNEQQAVLLSSRNSEQASSHVLIAVNCSALIHTPERSRQVDEVKAANPSLQSWLAPDLWEVFCSPSTAPVPAIKELAEDPEDRVAVYIHSSGTTG